MNQKRKSVNIPLDLATGSKKMDMLLRDRLQTPMDNLLAYFQMNKGTRLKWSDMQKIQQKETQNLEKINFLKLSKNLRKWS